MSIEAPANRGEISLLLVMMLLLLLAMPLQ
jgi:hypothetical protein